MAATLTAIQESGGRPAPSGRLEVAAAGGRHQLTVTAADLPPERSQPRQAYAVWLFNSRDDATRLGFVVPPVGTGGHFENHSDLPPQARRYREIVVTLESSAQTRPQGPIFLRGDLPTAALTGSVTDLDR
jgi:anti-sigma-K factor RskA